MPRRYNLRQRDKNVKWVKDETLKEKEDESTAKELAELARLKKKFGEM